MHKKSARLLSIIMSLALLFTTIPAYSAKAEEGNEVYNEIEKAASQHVTLPDTDTIKKEIYDARNDYMKKISEEIAAKKKITDDNTSGSTTVDGNKSVRIIVQLEGKTVKDLSGGMTLKEAASNASLQSKVLNSQTSCKNAVKKINPEAKIRNSYSLLINGFSFEGKAKDVDAIKEIPGVKDASIANEYSVSMNSAKDLTEAEKVWQEKGYKGEGVVVAIVDSGIDYTHKDMKITNTSKAKLHKGDAIVTSGPGKYYTDKVPYGYNFADKNDNIIDSNPGTGMHGMHVSGIVAANGDDSAVQNNEAIKGVAPEAQLLAMKVFSNNPNFASAFSDDIVSAIEDSVKHGADVINMSLGAAAGFVSDDSAEQKAVNEANDSGVVVVISAGNEQYSTAPYKLKGYYDTGILGAPGTSKEALTVASYENTKVTGPSIDYEAGSEKGNAYYTLSEVNPVKVLDKESGYDVVDCGTGSSNDDFAGKDLKGKIALIKRGGNSFIDKKIRAQAAGAAGVIVYNKDGDNTYINMATDSTVKIPAVFVSNADGVTLLGLINSGLKVKFNGTLVSIANVASGDMSDFSSWGPTPNLDLKPYVTAPGGNIWSTVNDNQYESMSGTSMASPHAAGCTALVVEHINKNFPDLKGEDKAELAKDLLVNTANVEIDPGAEEKNIPFSPRRQGAGLADVNNAVNNYVTALYNNNGDYEPVASLHEIDASSKAFTIKLHNYGTTRVTYNVKDNYGVLTEQDNSIASMSYDKKITGASLTFDKDTITVEAGKDAEVTCTLNISEGTAKNIYAEGYVTFESTDSKAPSIGMPYMGFYGKWDAEDNMDEPVWGNTLWGQETVYSKSNGYYYYLGYDKDTINPDLIGINPSDEYAYTNALPCLSFLRNVKDNKIEITDSNGKVIRQIAQDSHLRKSYQKSTYSIDDAWTWDGTVYNQSTGKYEPVADGQYYIQVRNTIDYDGVRENTLKMPVKVDSVAPEVSDLSYEDLGAGKYKIKFKASDNEGGIGIDNFEFATEGGIYKDEDGNKIFKLTPDKDGYYSFEMDLDSGNHVVEVVPIDYAGNMGIDSDKNSVVIANLHITKPQDGQEFSTGSFDLSFYVNPLISDKISKFVVFAMPLPRNDGSEFTKIGEADNTKSSCSVSGLDPGSYRILLVGFPNDGSGIIAYADEITVKINSQKLGFKVSGIEPGKVYGTSSIEVSGSFDNVPDVFKINDNDVTVDSTTKTFNAAVQLTEGLNKVHFYAVLNDKFGKAYEKVDYSINVYSQVAKPLIKITTPSAITNKIGDYIVDYVPQDASEYTVSGTVKDASNGSGYRLSVNGDNILTEIPEVPSPNPEEKSFTKTVQLNGKRNIICVKAAAVSGEDTSSSEKILIRKLEYFDVGIDFDNLKEDMEMNTTGSAIIGHYNFFNKPKSLKAKVGNKDYNAKFDSSSDTFSIGLRLAKGENSVEVTAESADGSKTFDKTFVVNGIESVSIAPVVAINGTESSSTVSIINVDFGTKSYTLTGEITADSNDFGAMIYVNDKFYTMLQSENGNAITINEEIPLDKKCNTVDIYAFDKINYTATCKTIYIIVGDDVYQKAGIYFDDAPYGSVYPTTDVRFSGNTKKPLNCFKINGKNVDILKDGDFDKTISLNEGKNQVKIEAEVSSGSAITVDEAATSTGSAITVDETVTIICDTIAPVINVTEPEDSSSVSSSTDKITLKGTIDEENGLNYFIVNGKVMQLGNDGAFSAEVSLNYGDNVISMIAEDAAGNRTIKKLTVNRLNESDAALASIKIDGTVIEGFRPDKYDYTVVVDGNTDKVPEVSCEIPESKISKAKAEITPASEIPGTTKIKVTAEDGTVLTYNIHFINAVTISKIEPTTDEFKLGSDAKVVISAENAADSSKEATLIVALYDSNNKFVTYAAANQVIKSKDKTQLMALINLPTVGTGYKVKCFVWDTLDSMKPLSKVIPIPVK